MYEKQFHLYYVEVPCIYLFHSLVVNSTLLLSYSPYLLYVAIQSLPAVLLTSSSVPNAVSTITPRETVLLEGNYIHPLDIDTISEDILHSTVVIGGVIAVAMITCTAILMLTCAVLWISKARKHQDTIGEGYNNVY